jgi:hypothetical protein
MDSRQGDAIETALLATLWFTRVEGSPDAQIQTKELLKHHLRQRYGLFAAKIWFKSHLQGQRARWRIEVV